jgi:hypothetical protein
MTDISSTLREAIQAFDDVRQPLVIRPDQKEVWRNFAQAITLDAAEVLVHAAAQEDGRRRDVGAGALDKIAVQADRMSGQIMMLKTEQREGRIVPASEPMPLRRTGFRQLCARAGAPSDYLAKIPARLAVACLQHGLVHSGADKDGLIRFAGDDVRAVVSGRYAALDDSRLLETLDAALGRLGLRNDVRVRAVATGPSTVLRLTIPVNARPVKRGDVIEYGLDIANGELGNRAVQIDPMTYRLVCSNGMRGWSRSGDARRLRHIGDPARLNEAFNDAIPAAIADASGQVNAMARATERLITNVGDEFSLLSSSLGLSQSEARDVTREVMAERKVALPEKHEAWGAVLNQQTDLTAFDVLNGITAFAKTRGTDRRLEIEEAAVGYLTRRAA